MALLQDLIQQIDDPVLRERIMQETDKLVKQKKFGLVFEEHLPECTPLYDVPIRVGCKVALKTGYVSDIYTVLKIDGDTVLCDRRETHRAENVPNERYRCCGGIWGAYLSHAEAAGFCGKCTGQRSLAYPHRSR